MAYNVESELSIGSLSLPSHLLRVYPTISRPILLFTILLLISALMVTRHSTLPAVQYISAYLLFHLVWHYEFLILVSLKEIRMSILLLYFVIPALNMVLPHIHPLNWVFSSTYCGVWTVASNNVIHIPSVLYWRPVLHGVCRGPVSTKKEQLIFFLNLVLKEIWFCKLLRLLHPHPRL